ncbi:arginine repressor [Ligilactobacillus pabuli]|uniref:Arginine repressor n=1 Tax=Ligilactobacillus pabuli TaxID=2886039 RepID=A0ABQ5JHJ8_9LACO|nr:ArgR family transcriptional regulator [Ligilactobacillus pabuli]GKS80972.1 arginine repressor [Ligilactobacillus pabuli]
MRKIERQQKIIELIRQQRIPNQEAMIQLLAEEGIKATQATVSRDIRQIRAIKEMNPDGSQYYVLLHEDPVDPAIKITETIGEIVLNVNNVHFINIIKTTPRDANVLAALIDENGLDGVVGTLAGYDTVVLFSPDDETALKVKDYFIEYMSN